MEEGGKGGETQTDPLCGESDELSDAVNRGGRAGQGRAWLCWTNTNICVKSNLTLCPRPPENQRVQAWNFKRWDFHHYQLLELTANSHWIVWLDIELFTQKSNYADYQIMTVNDDLIISQSWKLSVLSCSRMGLKPNLPSKDAVRESFQHPGQDDGCKKLRCLWLNPKYLGFVWRKLYIALVFTQ